MRTHRLNLEASEGTQWEETFLLFEDRARTKPFDLTGKVITFVFEDGPELTEGSGLEVEPEEGKIEVSTLITEDMDGTYRLNIAEAAEPHKPKTPIWGLFRVRKPRP